MSRRRIGLIGVPSSAGAHWPGQEKAPGVLRGAGLVGRLESAGCTVVDHGDLPRVWCRPDRRHPQNLAAVIEVARSVAGRVEGALRSGEIPLVVGGDCTIELGVLGRYSMPRYPAEAVRGRAEEAAAEALEDLASRGERFVVHFDADVIDLADFPVADVPQIKAGLTFRDAMACVGVFAASPGFGGLVITGFNPDHADEEGELAAVFVREVADVLAGNAP